MLLECCVDSVESAIEAQRGGADRLELCGNLMIGGTTPSIQFFNSVKKYTDIKVNVLLRPRFGDFCYSDLEFEILLDEVKEFAKAKADGIVIGVLKPDGTIDEERMARLIDAAQGLPITFHRAFDVTRDAMEALEVCERLGVSTILTSGQKNSAAEGKELLAQLVKKAQKVDILVGSGVSSNNLPMLIESTRAHSYHMSAKKQIESPMVYRREGVSMGLPMMSEFTNWRTDREEVARARAILDRAGGK